MKHLVISTIAVLVLIAGCSCRADIRTAIQTYDEGGDLKALTLFEAAANQYQAKIYLAKLTMNSDLDKAEDWIEKAIAQSPDKPEAYLVKGRIMGEQARNSVFSAFGYAKKARKSFQKAAQLAPTEIKYQRGLMMYYLHAPGFVGGDKDKARDIAGKIGELDKKVGLIAQIDIAAKTENQQALKQLMQAALDEFPLDSAVSLRAGFAYQRQERFAPALKHFQTVSDNEQKDLIAKYQAKYQIGRTAVLSEENLQLGIEALQDYIENHPTSRQLPEQHWAEFRLANLLELQDKKAQANAIYVNLSKVEDKELQKQLGKKI